MVGYKVNEQDERCIYHAIDEVGFVEMVRKRQSRRGMAAAMRHRNQMKTVV